MKITTELIAPEVVEVTGNVVELNDLQLALIGGGNADVTFH